MVDRQLHVYNYPEKHSEDKGCPLADTTLGRKSKCTECPFPDCIVGKRGVLGAVSRQERVAQAVALRSTGSTILVISETLGVNVRTVWQDLGGKK